MTSFPMKKPLLWLSLSAISVFLLAEWTDNGHIWQGLRECYLRGCRDAKVDDLRFKTFRTIPASDAPRAWPLHDRFTSSIPDAIRDSTEEYGTVALAVIHRDTPNALHRVVLYPTFFWATGASDAALLGVADVGVAAALGATVTEVFVWDDDFEEYALLDELGGLSRYLPISQRHISRQHVFVFADATLNVAALVDYIVFKLLQFFVLTAGLADTISDTIV